MMRYSPHMLPKVRSERIKDCIGGKLPGMNGMPLPCTLRISSFIPGHSCASQRTVIPGHYGSLGKGTATKVSDINMVAACFNCHDILDRRDHRWEYLKKHHEADVLRRLIAAANETQALLVAHEVIVVPGAEILKGYV